MMTMWLTDVFKDPTGLGGGGGLSLPPPFEVESPRMPAHPASPLSSNKRVTVKARERGTLDCLLMESLNDLRWISAA